MKPDDMLVNADINNDVPMSEYIKYKTYYERQMNYINNWNKTNKDKIQEYQRNYYHIALKDKPGFKDGLKTEHRKKIVSECYYRNKDRHKAAKEANNILNNIEIKPRGRPRKITIIQNVLINDNIVISDNE